MLIYPAIDLLNGACVRLRQGQFEDATTYGDPIEQAEVFARAGAGWLHVVDLEGARAGRPVQLDIVRDLARTSGLKIQCGGGVRGQAQVEALFEAGVSRVVVGSTAVREPETVRDWLVRFGPERICCAFDARFVDGDYQVATDAWAKSAGVTLSAAIERLTPHGLKHVLVTDIGRDGVLSGPNVELMTELVRAYPSLELQASGGVSSLADLAALRAVRAAGCIVGRALYQRCFSLEEVLAG